MSTPPAIRPFMNAARHVRVCNCAACELHYSESNMMRPNKSTGETFMRLLFLLLLLQLWFCNAKLNECHSHVNKGLLDRQGRNAKFSCSLQGSNALDILGMTVLCCLTKKHKVPPFALAPVALAGSANMQCPASTVQGMT